MGGLGGLGGLGGFGGGLWRSGQTEPTGRAREGEEEDNKLEEKFEEEGGRRVWTEEEVGGKLNKLGDLWANAWRANSQDWRNGNGLN